MTVTDIKLHEAHACHYRIVECPLGCEKRFPQVRKNGHLVCVPLHHCPVTYLSRIPHPLPHTQLLRGYIHAQFSLYGGGGVLGKLVGKRREMHDCCLCKPL